MSGRLRKAAGWVLALLGLWEFGDIAAVFVPGFGRIPFYLWNHILTGLLLMIVGALLARASTTRRARLSGWTGAAAGAWLVLASFLFGNPVHFAGLWNDVIVGALAFMLGAWTAITARRSTA